MVEAGIDHFAAASQGSPLDGLSDAADRNDAVLDRFSWLRGRSRRQDVIASL